MTLVEKRSHLQGSDRIQPPDVPYLQELFKPSESVLHPSILQINTGVYLSQIAQKYGYPLSLAQLPDDELIQMMEGFDKIWLMGIYERSAAARNTALRYTDEYRSSLPDLDPNVDVDASPFALPSYRPNPIVASSWEEWDELVLDRFHNHNRQIIIDFVPNHVAGDHPWITDHPEYLISAPLSLAQGCDPLEFDVRGQDGNMKALAHGKPGWTIPWIDTYQLNYAHPQLQSIQAQNVCELAEHSDGIRCDMANLILSQVFGRNWGWLLSDEEKLWLQKNPFWKNVINKVGRFVNDSGRDFHFIAEAYDPDEIMALINEGFKTVYDKTGLYDTLVRTRYQTDRDGILTQIARHIDSGNNSLLSFIENHDEPRAVAAFGGKSPSQAAAVISGLLPGMWMMHMGQDEGRVVKLPMQVKRLPTDEPVDTQLVQWYKRLSALRRSVLFQNGKASIPDHSQLNEGIVAIQFSLDGTGAIVGTNYSDRPAEGMIPVTDGGENTWLYDLTKNTWLRGNEIAKPTDGKMYLSLEPWQSQMVIYSKDTL